MAIAAHGADQPSAPALPAATSRRSRTRRSVAGRPVNLTALVVVGVGVLAQLVALVTATWFSSAGGRLGFTGLAAWAQPGYGRAFVDWIAWLLVAVSAGCAGAACARWRGAATFRYVGALVCVAAAFLTVASVLVIAHQARDNSFRIARNYSLGVYLDVLGLLVTALGAAAGTGRRG